MTNNWIPVKYLPDKAGTYLVYVHAPEEMYDKNDSDTEWNYISMAFFNKAQGGIWEMEFGDAAYGCYLEKINLKEEYYISHWMALPDGPEESEVS